MAAIADRTTAADVVKAAEKFTADAAAPKFGTAKIGTLTIRVPEGAVPMGVTKREQDRDKPTYLTLDTVVKDVIAALESAHQVTNSWGWERRLDPARHHEVALGQLQRRAENGYLVNPATGRAYPNGRLKVLANQVARASLKVMTARKKELDKQEAANAKAEAKQKAADLKVVERHVAKQVGACGAVLPQGAKPTKMVAPKTSNDITQTHAWIVKLTEGWALVGMTGPTISVLPLWVEDERKAGLRDAYPIPEEALQAIEKAGAFRVDKDGAVIPVSITWGTSIFYTDGKTVKSGWGGSNFRTVYMPAAYYPVAGSEGGGYKPKASICSKHYALTRQKVEGVRGKPGALRPVKQRDRIEIAVDSQLLTQLQQVLGAAGKSSDAAKGLTLVIDRKALLKQEDGAQTLAAESPIRVETSRQRHTKRPPSAPGHGVVAGLKTDRNTK